MPVITIQSRGRRNALGWFIRKAWTNDDCHVPEINISAEYLQRSVADIVGTLIHEMVHLSNFLAGIRDCTINNYHNRQFKELAERVKLICERADDGKNQFGWAYTTPSPELCRIINDLQVDESAFCFYRNIPATFVIAGIGREKADEPAEPKLKKWTCGCTNIWSAVEVRAVCLSPACGGDFRRSVVFR